MNSFEIYQIDAFTDQVFSGNPACVVPLKEWLPDNTMLKIAKENGVAETAFFIEEDDGFYLRWFTPEIEMDLCGHATLATAHCIFKHLEFKGDQLVFSSSSGELIVKKIGDKYQLDFPSRMPKHDVLPDIIEAALNIQPSEVLKSRDYVLVYSSEEDISKLIVDQSILDQINLDPGGVVMTAKGKACDFVSRYFTPQSSILEDPVTGSAHCSLIPLWSERLGKEKMIARQLSDRGGILWCELNKDRVLISGKAVTYSIGKFYL
jgi:PhzF family phenazine biosynthesis protein